MVFRNSPIRRIVVVVMLLLAFEPGRAAGASSVKVFGAASLNGALSEAIRAFEAGSDFRYVAVFASSSNLAKQILNGAPADVFISANTAWMDHLQKRGLIEPGSQTRLLGNQLSLIAPASSPAVFEWNSGARLSSLLSGRRLAMGDPDHVPIGMYGAAALSALGLWSDIQSHLAFAANARAAVAFVERGEAPLGVVYSSDLAGRTGIREVARFPKSAYPPIIYPLAVIKGRSSPAVQTFVNFLQSEDGRAIFDRHGFSSP